MVPSARIVAGASCSEAIDRHAFSGPRESFCVAHPSACRSSSQDTVLVRGESCDVGLARRRLGCQYQRALNEVASVRSEAL